MSRDRTANTKTLARGPGRPTIADREAGMTNVKDTIRWAARIEFAERGFKLTTMRDIADRCGVTAALIGYYFGSKQQLYDEVVDLCTMHLNYPRLQMLDELEQKAGPGGPALVDILNANILTFRPVLHDPHSHAAVYLRIFGRVFTEPGAEVVSIIDKSFSALRQRFVAAIANAVPNVPKREIYLRYTCMIGALLYVGASPKTVESISSGKITTTDANRFWDHFVDGWCAMFEAPMQEMSQQEPPATPASRRSKRLKVDCT